MSRGPESIYTGDRKPGTVYFLTFNPLIAGSSGADRIAAKAPLPQSFITVKKYTVPGFLASFLPFNFALTQDRKISSLAP